jgi:succinate dehydrogenase / fumarate reductase membrane anchor subunit
MAATRHRNLGPAKTGTGHWWHQRLTAIALIPLTLFLVGLLPSMAGASYREFLALMAIPVTPILLLLLVGAGLYHMKLGLQVVIEDYVHHEATKVTLQIALVFATALLGVAGLISILMLATRT